MTLLLPLDAGLEAKLPLADVLADKLHHLTEDEFFAFCQANKELKLERRADGTIDFLALTGGDTGRRNTKLVSRLDRWAEDTGLGLVFDSSTGFRLPSGAVRSPDAAWVSQAAWESLSAEQRRKFPPLCPDFVVELLSASDSPADMALKMQEYLDNGCRLGWLLDPKAETAHVYRASGEVSEIQGFANILSGEDVLPGFSFQLSLLK